jgi:hypothetical protein
MGLFPSKDGTQKYDLLSNTAIKKSKLTLTFKLLIFCFNLCSIFRQHSSILI